jgi:hypothetical protein
LPFLFLFQIAFWSFFILPTQGFFNALIYFYSATKQPRRSSTTTEQPELSSFFAPALQQWGSFQRSFSKRRSAASADPIVAVAARVRQDMELEEDLVVEEIDRNGASEVTRIPSDPVGMDLPTISEGSNLEH